MSNINLKTCLKMGLYLNQDQMSVKNPTKKCWKINTKTRKSNFFHSKLTVFVGVVKLLEKVLKTLNFSPLNRTGSFSTAEYLNETLYTRHFA